MLENLLPLFSVPIVNNSACDRCGHRITNIHENNGHKKPFGRTGLRRRI